MSGAAGGIAMTCQFMRLLGFALLAVPAKNWRERMRIELTISDQSQEPPDVMSNDEKWPLSLITAKMAFFPKVKRESSFRPDVWRRHEIGRVGL